MATPVTNVATLIGILMPPSLQWEYTATSGATAPMFRRTSARLPIGPRLIISIIAVMERFAFPVVCLVGKNRLPAQLSEGASRMDPCGDDEIRRLLRLKRYELPP